MNILGISGLLGYVLWWLFELTNNYGLAIILFSVTINLLMFPFTVKARKSMLSSSRISKKQNELKKKYANDNKKYNEEIAKLYEREGVNPASGCLPQLVNMVVMLSMFGTILNPLQNMLHISADKIRQAADMLNTIPGIGSAFDMRYAEISVIKAFPYLKNHLTMFSVQEAQDIMEFNAGFNFFGIDLLSSPIKSSFWSFLWLIPVLHAVISIASQYIMQKMNGTQNQMQGCMKYTMYLMPLMFIYITFIAPTALGIYYIVGGLIALLQNIITGHFYSVAKINAKQEAQRVVLLEKEESQIGQGTPKDF